MTAIYQVANEIEQEVRKKLDHSLSNKKAQLCNLKKPADCEHRVDGKLSHIILCGNNPLSYTYKDCPYKQEAEINIPSSPECSEYTAKMQQLIDEITMMFTKGQRCCDLGKDWYEIKEEDIEHLKHLIK